MFDDTPKTQQEALESLGNAKSEPEFRCTLYAYMSHLAVIANHEDPLREGIDTLIRFIYTPVNEKCQKTKKSQ